MRTKRGIVTAINELDKNRQNWTIHDNSGQLWTELDIAPLGKITSINGILVAPYFPRADEMLVDWIPPEKANGQGCIVDVKVTKPRGGK